MKTYLPKVNEIPRKWFIVDAAGKPLGKVAAAVAKVLRGKNKVIFTPHLDTGDYVIVINAGQVELSGKKLEQKYYRYHSGYTGGLKEIVYKDLLQKNPELAIEVAVKGMLPKNRIGRKMIKKMKVYRSAEHDHAAQKPEILEVK